MAKLWGPPRGVPGGLGTWSVRDGDLVVGALFVVNAVGEIVDDDGSVLAGPRLEPGERREDLIEWMRAGNTTIGVIATNAVLSKPDARRLAEAANDAVDVAVQPAHTLFDGDAVFSSRYQTGGRDLRRCWGLGRGRGDDGRPSRRPAIAHLGMPRTSPSVDPDRISLPDHGTSSGRCSPASSGTFRDDGHGSSAGSFVHQPARRRGCSARCRWTSPVGGTAFCRRPEGRGAGAMADAHRASGRAVHLPVPGLFLRWGAAGGRGGGTLRRSAAALC